MKRLGLKTKPKDIQLKQAAAAVGQPALVWEYEKAFKEHRKTVAQVLLTRDALSDRTMYMNFKNTLNALIERGVITIINENDTVATDEIKFGDNDRLAAMVASLLEADRPRYTLGRRGPLHRRPKARSQGRADPAGARYYG